MGDSTSLDLSTTSIFLYGSLIKLEALKHIIEKQTQVFSALLEDFTCHPVKERNYSAIIPYPYGKALLCRELLAGERCVRGSVIAFLTYKRLESLDSYMGDEFKRVTVSVLPLMHASLDSKIQVQTYIWVDGLGRLVADLSHWPIHDCDLPKQFRSNGYLDRNEKQRLLDVANIVISEDLDPDTKANERLPEFGHTILSKFCFDEKYINLNHGSYGSLPRPVADATAVMMYEIEKRPDKFLRRGFYGPLNAARERLARLVNADVDNLVLVPNATHGMGTVLRNMIWSSDDVIVPTTCTYSSIMCGIQYIRDVPPHPSIATLKISFNSTHEQIVEHFRCHLQSIPRKETQKILAVIDSIAGFPGCLLPWKEMVQVCKEENVMSLVDASHSIGHEMDIDLKNVDPDFWVSNCHKWLYVKRGCAILYIPLRNQHLIQSSLPTSEYYVSPEDSIHSNYPTAPNFIQQFAWNGTRDYAPYLSVHAALDFRKSLGGEKRINSYCHTLALKGRQRLLDILKTSAISEEFTANMCNVELPLAIPPEFPSYKLASIKKEIEDKLLDEWNCFAVPYIYDGKWYIRCSAQVFNELSDFDYMGNALLLVCAELRAQYGLQLR